MAGGFFIPALIVGSVCAGFPLIDMGYSAPKSVSLPHQVIFAQESSDKSAPRSTDSEGLSVDSNGVAVGLPTEGFHSSTDHSRDSVHITRQPGMGNPIDECWRWPRSAAAIASDCS